jgi:hypothetical protein
LFKNSNTGLDRIFVSKNYDALKIKNPEKDPGSDQHQIIEYGKQNKTLKELNEK